jgi:NADPH-dependent curcumin reductase CurA
MRGRMSEAKSYVPPFELGAVLEGGAVGAVVESNSPDLAPGDKVLHQMGWREYAVAPASAFRKVDEHAAPLSRYLGVLGMPGLTAWVGVVDIGALQQGESFFVSGAAGAVGSLAGQVAKLRGASRVVGSAGSDAKVKMLTEELGFDAAFNYKSGPVAPQLKAAAPGGIDVYFDNVGGEHLEAAIASMQTHGRVAACGMIALYTATDPTPAPRNLILVVGKRITIRGYIILDHYSRFPDFVSEVGGWLREGKIQAPETIMEGIENAPAAFIGVLRGDNIGKMLVRL